MPAPVSLMDAAAEKQRMKELIQDALSDLVGSKHNASGNPADPGYAHGPGGLLSFPGVDSQVFHTVVSAQPGLLNELPTRGSVLGNPLYEILTGVYGDSGSEKTNVCDDPPAGGIAKAGIISAPFGRYERRTREIEINRLGQFNDRADPMDLRLVGSIDLPGAFRAPGQGNPLANEISKALWERAISLHRLLAQQVWTGNPTNNTAGGGYREFPGLRLLVNTGYVDAINNARLASLDSDVKDFGYRRLDGNGNFLINSLSYLARYTRSLASRTGMDPVRWVLAMREELFYEITAVWACAYMTYRCAQDAATYPQTQYNVDQGDTIALRDAMRQGRYLLIDGIRYDVVFDDGIPEDTNTNNANVPSGCMSSDIFLIPMSVMGGQAVTFVEYFDMGNESIQAALNTGLLADVRANGPWLEGAERSNQCVFWWAKIEPRIVLRTPWLAGRLRNVVYCPLQHTREPFPTDPYFVDGGSTTRPGPSYYAHWQS